MRRFARASQRFGSQPVQCGFALYPGSTRLITARHPPRRPLSSFRSALADYDYDSSNNYDGYNNYNYYSSYNDDHAVPPDDVDGDATGVLEVGVPPAVQMRSSKRLEGRKASEFWTILKEGQPDQVMSALLNPRYETFVATMPASSFAEAFFLLSPAYFVEPFRLLHEPMHPTTVHVRGFKRLETIFDEFANNVAKVAEIRRSAGHRFGLAEYSHLLRCASSVGDALFADQVWHNMQEDKVRPDVSCYNHLMSAKVWNSSHHGRQQYRLRMTKYIYRKRGYFDPNPGWEGFGTKARSVRKEVVQILNEMIEAGLVGDEKTFIHVMMSSSRVGSADGVRKLLKAVWGIDMDELEENLKPDSPLPLSSPIRPTKNLQFAVAHAFGTTSDIRSALWLVELISESHGVPISEEVWLELFKWSFVLSRERWGPDLEGKDRGFVTPEFVQGVYNTMTSEPFNVRPTAQVHMFMGKTAWDLGDLTLFNKHLGAVYDLLAETRRKQRMARSKVRNYLTDKKATHGPKARESSTTISPLKARRKLKISPFKSRHFANAIYEYDLLRLRAAQESAIVSRLVRLLIIKRAWDTGDDEHAWERRLLPRALEEWQDFLPDQLHYETSGGWVSRNGFSTWRFRRYTPFSHIPIRRMTPEIGLKREIHPQEIDDDLFWANVLRKKPELYSEGLLTLTRLFEGVIERSTVSHPEPHDPFTYEPLADGKKYHELMEFYRQNDSRAIKQYRFLQDPESEYLELEDSTGYQEDSEFEDPADTAIRGFNLTH